MTEDKEFMYTMMEPKTATKATAVIISAPSSPVSSTPSWDDYQYCASQVLGRQEEANPQRRFQRRGAMVSTQLLCSAFEASVSTYNEGCTIMISDDDDDDLETTELNTKMEEQRGGALVFPSRKRSRTSGEPERPLQHHHHHYLHPLKMMNASSLAPPTFFMLMFRTATTMAA